MAEVSRSWGHRSPSGGVTLPGSCCVLLGFWFGKGSSWDLGLLPTGL